MKKILFPFLLLTAGFAVFQSCNKQNGKAKLAVYLTDDPADYKEVNIDIKEVLVNVGDNGSENWKSVPITPGIYNLLDFRNGMDVLLGTIELPAGKISQMRMVLGSNNTLVDEAGKSYDLKTPSAQQSGLKFNLNNVVLTEGITYKIWIDFDAGRSVVKAGNSGIYNLKPVIRTYSEAVSGAIKGIILPSAADAWVYAIKGATDTVASAKPDATTGFFMMKGIAPDTYKLGIDANNNYKDSVVSPVTVTLGAVTDVGTVTLKQ
ncbi:MAG TPA: DUF4382 domain-containing protein [Lacibacter sp.]|nr:DUF4382 domain-containing protein [Lacibacter sp.]